MPIMFIFSGVGIMPYLPSLMDYLLGVLKNSPLQKPKELAISAIGAAANAAGEEMKTYFNDILGLFRAYLTTQSEDDEFKKLQVATIGKKMFCETLYNFYCILN